MHLLEVILWILNVSVALGQLNDNCQHGTLRLVNGSATNNGRLEICINFVWGSVCGDYYFRYYGNARVACRQLGYEVDGGQSVSYYGSAYYGQSTGPIWLNRLYCTGSENNLLDCNRGVDIGNAYGCSHSRDVGIVCPANSCSTGSVRLTDGLILTEGTVEVCNDGAWTSVCDYRWGYQESFVVCRQLGLPATDAQPVYYSNSFGYGHGIPTLYNWRCFGNESSLNDCLKSTSSCYYSYRSVYRISGVRCKGSIVPGNCSTGSMRLVGPNGPNKVEGRVEYCSNGVWGTVSSYGFDVRDAHVVCRRLGHQTPRALIFWNAYFGQGSGPVLFHYLGCNGNEDRLEHCTYSTSFSVSHTTDVSVKCSERVLTDCINGSVRLVNGTTPDEGRVEVCINGEWGTACDQYWDRRETKVVCRQLQYSQNTEGSIFRNSEFGDGDYQQILWKIQCTGSETNLTSCNNYHYRYCYYGRTVGIKCYNTSNCTHGEIKLYGRQSNAEGDLQICFNGVWVFVCDSWWISPNIVCRQLGYQDTNWALYSYNSLFGGNKNVAPIMYIRFSCSGNENSLKNCYDRPYNYYCNTARGFTCSSVVNCSNGTVHLTDGGGDNEGRVEICTDGIWMTIDPGYWNYNNAKVVCRQLGYYDTWSVAITDTNWSGKNERVGYRYVCTGTENELSNCSKYSPSSYANDWFNQKRGGVDCQYNDTKKSPIHYSMTIDTDTDAVSIGSRVVLTCNVSPAPPVNSTYDWRRTVSGTSSFTQYRDTDPNVTLTINAGHTTHENYYCIVKYNGVVIGRGHTVITVKGLLQQSYGNIQYSNENGFVGILTVNTIDTTVTEYLRELNWYYNGNKISNSSKYLINNGIHINENSPPVIYTDVITGFSNEFSSVTLTSYVDEYSNEGSVSLYHNETPHFNFSSNSTSFIQDYNVQLSCSVSGGYPLYRNITLIKNG
uniref:Deleted in malignant brain tumors 1 protein-like n=1 Tax=Amphimedon queenslandica TaxID=400682 RepID=A0A1X7VTW1_AMPQE